jgi:hypothetical protein
MGGAFPSNLAANPVAAGVTGGVGGLGGAAVAGVTGAASPPQSAAAAAAGGPRQFMASYDLLVGGDSTGGLFVWEPFNVPQSTGDRETPPRLVKQAHSGEVWAMCLAPGPEDPVATSARVYTAGGWGSSGLVGRGSLLLCISTLWRALIWPVYQGVHQGTVFCTTRSCQV